MGTRFRTMLAPVGVSTGDGRRFKAGAITTADVPFAFEWVRSREEGHDGAVTVGAVQETNFGTVKEAVANDWISADAAKGMDQSLSAVWASGEMYDDADRETMPQLAEDVASAMHLMAGGTLGPSVDLDSFEGVPVFEGSDEPITWEDIEEYYLQHGEEPKVELLITEGRVRAGTLVSIPAFAETSRPLELIEVADQEASTDTVTLVAGEQSLEEAAVRMSRERLTALIASVVTDSRMRRAALFDAQPLTGPTPITWDFDNSLVFGHIATWQTCHVGYSDVCVTAPRDDEAGDYAWFNRFPVETQDGTVWAGRITVGGHHGALSLNASEAMAAYDTKTVAAHVRAYSDEFGIAVTGVIEPGLTGTEVATLNRRKVSGDWRETPGGLTLVEVLALSRGPRAHAEPGFPVPGTFSVAGRQTALTAALGPAPDAVTATRGWGGPSQLRTAVREALAEDRAALAARAELNEALKFHTEEERAALADLMGVPDGV